MNTKPRYTVKIKTGGCLPLILFIFTLTALWFGLPTPWGTLNLDLIPPAIRLIK